jgi:hypothetical protein
LAVGRRIAYVEAKSRAGESLDIQKEPEHAKQKHLLHIAI